MSLKQSFGIDSDMEVDAFSKRSEYVPEIDKNYKFDRDTTLAIISGFAFNKRVLVQGYHGTGKSTHIEQIAARLNWPCIRVNLDSHVSRIDLIGKDAIIVKDGKQITEFKEGILPWSIQNPVALVFDEYDAGRPDVMFVIQRVLEAEGNFTLLDKNKVIKQNKFFRFRFDSTNFETVYRSTTESYEDARIKKEEFLSLYNNHDITQCWFGSYVSNNEQRKIIENELPGVFNWILVKTIQLH